MRRGFRWNLTVLGLGCLAMSACIPTYKGELREPNTLLPDDFQGQRDNMNSAQTNWKDFFADPHLTSLIELALKNNQEINIVSLEVAIAQNEILSREGEFLPKLGFNLGTGIEKPGSYTSKGASDEANGLPSNLADFSFGFRASWELDIWGKLRNATKAARMRYLSTEEGRKFAVSRLVAELADSYYELLALDALVLVTQQNIEVQQNAREVVRLQKDAGRVTELAVKRFEAEVLKNQSRLFAIQQQVVETENRINFLVGRLPQRVERSTQLFTLMLPAVVHAGVPSQLLENRPDVRQAQLELAAAQLDVDIAKASFYPSLGIGATIGYQSFDFLKLLATPASLLYGLAADVMVPLLNRNGLTATYNSANAKQMQAVYAYERSVLNGCQEVSSRLSLINNLEKSYDLRTQEVEKLNQSIEISSRLFASARADYMEVLLTRRDALDAQLELIETKKQQLLATVALYQSLGGGWH